MLAKGPPMTDENENLVRDKRGNVIHEPYRIKVLNTINFKKSMHYNPFTYIRSEKDILKLVKYSGRAGEKGIYESGTVVDYRW